MKSKSRKAALSSRSEAEGLPGTKTLQNSLQYHETGFHNCAILSSISKMNVSSRITLSRHQVVYQEFQLACIWLASTVSCWMVTHPVEPKVEPRSTLLLAVSALKWIKELCFFYADVSQNVVLRSKRLYVMLPNFKLPAQCHISSLLVPAFNSLSCHSHSISGKPCTVASIHCLQSSVWNVRCKWNVKAEPLRVINAELLSVTVVFVLDMITFYLHYVL